jgi:Uma2 family endonuclease
MAKVFKDCIFLLCKKLLFVLQKKLKFLFCKKTFNKMYASTFSTSSSYQYSTSSRTPKLRLSQDVLDVAKNRLLDKNPPQEGIVLATNVSLESYVDFCEEKKLPVKLRLINGKVVAYELPQREHSSATFNVGLLISEWAGGRHAISGTTEEDLIVAGNSYFTADLAIRPRNLPPPLPGRACNSRGSAYPTLVLEVGNTESISSLHGLAPFYLSPRTTIMIYLAIKLYSPRQDGTRAMVVMLYQRSSPTPNIPTRVISFGDAPIHTTAMNFFTNTVRIPGASVTGFGRFGAPPCNAPNLPMYQLQIPAAEIFHRSPTTLPSLTFDLDLWEVKDSVYRF